jgi:hypothetical protein
MPRIILTIATTWPWVRSEMRKTGWVAMWKLDEGKGGCDVPHESLEEFEVDLLDAVVCL